MAKTNHNQPLTPREIEVIKGATSHVACVFKGRGAYLKYEITSGLEDAVSVAAELAKRENKVATLYAVMGKRQAVICNYYPDGRVSLRPEK